LVKLQSAGIVNQVEFEK